MKKVPLTQIIFALRREGLEVIHAENGYFPQIVIKQPTAEMWIKAEVMQIRKEGKRYEKRMYLTDFCSITW